MPKTRAVLAATALMAGLATADAGAAPAACGAAKVEGTAGGSAAAQEQARRAPVVRVTDAATASRPVVVTYEQPAGAAYFAVDGLLVFRTAQVVSRTASGRLWVRAEFPTRAVDVDMYADDAAGNRIARSDSANNETDAAFAAAGQGSNGGPGFELLKAMPVRRCAALSVFTASTVVPPGTTVRLLLWLGGPA